MSHDKKLQPKICFVASGGGHLRQLLQLSALWGDFPYYFVTEKTSLGQSLTKDHRTRFVPHFAFGQRKSDGWLKFLWSGIGNAFVSTAYFFREWPDVVITSGAGAAFVTLVWARFFGKKIVYIESIARVTEVSLFGRLAQKHAGLIIVQWPSMEKLIDGAICCSPLVVDDLKEEVEREGVLVTVGTVMPFDRMVAGVQKLLEEGKIKPPVAAQIGDSLCDYDGIESFKSCPFEELNARMVAADVVVCHGGSGSILGALKAGAHVVAMARLSEYGEHYDDHQKDITKAFADMNLISIAADENDIERAIAEAKARPRRTVNIDCSDYVRLIKGFIATKGRQKDAKFKQA